MKLGVSFETNIIRKLTSWKSATDPSSGDYHYEMETHGVPEVFVREGTINKFRTGPMDGQRFSGNPDTQGNNVVLFEFVSNQSEVYYTVKLIDNSTLSRAVMNSTGLFERWDWSNEKNAWTRFWFVPTDTCDNYAYCGANSICSFYALATCKCVIGFVPLSSSTSDGCVRQTNLGCSLDRFQKIENIKLPDTYNSTSYKYMNDSDQCQSNCLQNCFCTAYAINGANGCVLWFGDLLDIRAFPYGGDVLYIRLAPEFGDVKNTNTNKLHIIVLIPVVLGFLLLAFFSLACWHSRRRKTGGYERGQEESSTGQDSTWLSIKTELSQKSTGEESETVPLQITLLRVLPSFDLATIRTATNGFSIVNKLGEGGFGVVYKGQLHNGHEIAVKKLSRHSFQGPEEFRNELLLIANLQHRNLVRLLGCCVEEDERILVLEFMQNGSLDNFIYDKTRRKILDWRKRLDIIIGVARGLLYLHHDSNMKVIHRDLKPSNILLDQDYIPKISDFGISRIFEGDEKLQKHTRTLVGTIGYMAPEYATDGIFSLKSDVFSFGVLVLEILSGQRNKVFNQATSNTNLLGHAYKLWKEGRSLEILDETLESSYVVTEVLRCIKVGLLCVQEESEDRPTIAEVVLLLSSEDPMLTPPKSPAESPNFGGDLSAMRELTVTVTGR